MRVGLIDADLMWQKRASGRRYGKTKADFKSIDFMDYEPRKCFKCSWYFK